LKIKFETQAICSLCILCSILCASVCLAVAVCSSEALRLPLKPPPFLQNQIDEWKDDAQEVKDHIEEELQAIKDKWDHLQAIKDALEDLCNAGDKDGITSESPVESTTAPEVTTTAAAATTPVIFTDLRARMKFFTSSKIFIKINRLKPVLVTLFLKNKTGVLEYGWENYIDRLKKAKTPNFAFLIKKIHLKNH
jgi:hypothetical protein